MASNSAAGQERTRLSGIRPLAASGGVAFALFVGLALLVQFRVVAPLDEATMATVVASRSTSAGAAIAMNWVFRLGYAPLDVALVAIWSAVLLFRRRSLRLAALPLLLIAVIGVQTGARLVVARPGPILLYAATRDYAPDGAVRAVDQVDVRVRSLFVAVTGAGDANDQGLGSYPSGHAARIAFLGLVGFLGFAGRSRDWRLVAGVALGAVALQVGYSTLFFGYHWPSDVLGGYLLGLGVGGLGASAIGAVDRMGSAGPRGWTAGRFIAGCRQAAALDTTSLSAEPFDHKSKRR